MVLIKDLPKIFDITATEQMFLPFFPLFLLIIFALAIERFIFYIRVVIKTKRNDLSSIFSDQANRIQLTSLEYCLNKRLVIFIFISLFYFLRIGIMFFYGILTAFYAIEVWGEFDPIGFSDGIQMQAADGIFFTITIFSSYLFYFLFQTWKNRIIYRYQMSFYESPETSGKEEKRA